ncbi:amidohydrolase family protein [Demequina sp. SYSU T00039]|uniref:Amidohydrolase family protein n=1 Tax=Demequina lignilytica TaxID=3051663 RepID=A0AAW7M2B6_9MICO|nr:MULTISPECIES: amidohydrolase family protein [unclassified Demequina]MDN4477219.1 amidohydrolase family protein [Demequina sp. SYSU T00039-1]MDN4487392.1 amidohydrolase family protein [Demequina sp. SYSU T00039]MDN4491145.1 amidohydrolase family protein [Demequina sp. SYSU T00068]
MAIRLSGPVLAGDGDVRDGAWVVDGRITYREPAAPVTATLDGVVVPGLVDVHCHVGLDSGGEVDRDLALKQAMVDRDAGTLLIRDAGSPTDTRFLDAVADAPRIVRAARFIARPKRYLRYYAREIEVSDLPAVMAEEARKSDGWVKIIADWIDRDAGDLTPLWPADVLAEGIAAAHEQGARVTAHTFATEAADALLDGGIDCIEHGTGLQPEHVEECVRRGIPVVPTLLQVANFEGYAEQGAEKFPAYSARMRAMHERRFAHVRAMHEAGVPLLVGTDAGGTIGHGVLPDEAALLVEAGIPADEVVAIASWRARAFLGAPVLEEGEPADLVVYAADPRVDIAALASPRHVMLRGALV